MKKKNKQYIKTLVIIAFLITVLYLLLKDDYQMILSALSKLHMMDVFLLALLASSPYMINGIVLTKLCRQIHSSYTYKDGLINGWVSLFLMNISASALAKGGQLILMKAKKISYDHGCGILMLDQMLYQISYAVFSFMILLCSSSYLAVHYPKELPFAWAGICIGIIPIAAMLFLFLYPKLPALVIRLLHFCITKFHLKIDEAMLCEKINTFSNAVWACYPKSRKEKINALKIILWQIFRLFLRHILPFFIAYALTLPVNLHNFFMYFMASVFIDLILSSLPVYGKHGVAESSFILVFTPFVNKVNAASMMLLWRILTFYVNTLIGAVFTMLCKDIDVKEVKESFINR